MNTYRHGEIALVKIEKLPEGLKKSDIKILMKGSHSNSHSIDKGEIFFKQVDSYIFGYLIAKNTSLLHTEHGEGKEKLKVAKIEDGIYELRKQQEIINSELKPVVD